MAPGNRQKGAARGLQASSEVRPPQDTHCWHPQAVPSAWARKGSPGVGTCAPAQQPFLRQHPLSAALARRNQQSKTLAPGGGQGVEGGSPFSTKKPQVECTKALPANQRLEGCFAAPASWGICQVLQLPPPQWSLSVPLSFPAKDTDAKSGRPGTHGPQEREYRKRGLMASQEALSAGIPPGQRPYQSGRSQLAEWRQGGTGGPCRRGSQAGKRLEGPQTRA